MGFNLEDYEPVAARLQRWLDMDHSPHDPSVRTFMVSEPSSDICVFRAELWLCNYTNDEEFLVSTDALGVYIRERSVCATPS